MVPGDEKAAEQTGGDKPGRLRDGMNWAPTSSRDERVVEEGQFAFASAFFDHGHIYGQTNGLRDAGGTCKLAWDPDPEKLDRFCATYPTVQRAQSYEQILEDPEIRLVTAAAVPSDRFEVGRRCLEAGKDYLTDKSPFTTLSQLEAAREVVRRTKRKYMCDYSERLHTEAGWHAGEMLAKGAVGRVLSVIIMAPHNLAPDRRPGWFWEKQKFGGILTDIGSHQVEQFLTYTGATDGVVNFARVDNFHNPGHPEFEDFGEVSFRMDNGASCYCRLDWFNPAGLRTWGDGRTFVIGTEGSLEVRKYVDLATEPMESQVIYWVNGEREQRIPCQGKIGYPFYGRLIRDCLDRTEHAMTQTHCFKAAELSMQAQAAADRARAASGA